jgi:hypothetical protein
MSESTTGRAELAAEAASPVLANLYPASKISNLNDV